MPVTDVRVIIRRGRAGPLALVRLRGYRAVRFRFVRLTPASYADLHAQGMAFAISRAGGEPVIYQLPLPLEAPHG